MSEPRRKRVKSRSPSPSSSSSSSSSASSSSSSSSSSSLSSSSSGSTSHGEGKGTRKGTTVKKSSQKRPESSTRRTSPDRRHPTEKDNDVRSKRRAREEDSRVPVPYAKDHVRDEGRLKQVRDEHGDWARDSKRQCRSVIEQEKEGGKPEGGTARGNGRAAPLKKVNVIVDQPATITGRTGGVYIPPFKLAQMKKDAAAMGKSTKEYQRIAWEALRKSVNGLINKVNTTNIKMIAPELFQLNLVRGRGLFARAVMKAQLASPGFTPVFAALVAVVNTKLPENGELILKRVIVAFRRAYKRRDKVVATALAKFVAHMVNQQVAHELLALQLLTVLLEEPTDDSVEIAVNFTKEIGQVLQELSPQGLHAVFERFRGILHEGQIDKRVQYTIETLFAVRKSGFSDYPSVPPELDLVERDDQITFEIGLEDKLEKEEMLDIFRMDDKYEENEAMWAKIKAEILGESDSDEDDEEEEEDDDSDDQEDDDDQGKPHSQMTQQIQDLTEQDLVNLRRTIYLTIMSSAGFEECAHKLAKLDIQEGYEMELCNMMIECCSQERTWLPYYGLIAQRFCMMHRRWQGAFAECFETNYNTIHRLETNKLRNVAKFFAHLLYTDALPWTCLESIRLSEDATTSSSRIFIKILVLELSENMGLKNLKERFNDPYMNEFFEGMFPTENPRNTRFAINFFTAIGLGGLTDGLRLHLKNAPKMIMEAQMAAAAGTGDGSSSSSSTSSSSSSESSSTSSSSSDSDSSSSDSDSDSD